MTRHFVLDSYVHEIFWCWQRKKRKSSLRHTENLPRKNGENNSSSNKRRKKVCNLNKISISIFLSFFLFCFLFLLLFSLFLFFLLDFSYCSYSLLTIFIFPTFSPYFLPINFPIPLFCIDYLPLPSFNLSLSLGSFFSMFHNVFLFLLSHFCLYSPALLCLNLFSILYLSYYTLYYSLIRSLVLLFIVPFYFYFSSSLCLIKFPIFSFLLFFV